jgi:hypothetical protein
LDIANRQYPTGGAAAGGVERAEHAVVQVMRLLDLQQQLDNLVELGKTREALLLCGAHGDRAADFTDSLRVALGVQLCDSVRFSSDSSHYQVLFSTDFLRITLGVQLCNSMRFYRSILIVLCCCPPSSSAVLLACCSATACVASGALPTCAARCLHACMPRSAFTPSSASCTRPCCNSMHELCLL